MTSLADEGTPALDEKALARAEHSIERMEASYPVAWLHSLCKRSITAYLAALPSVPSATTPMRRFTMFRRGDLSATHNEHQANAPDVPQFEGVVFTDGTVALRWLTAFRSTSVWADLDTAMGVHGHPEERYRSEIVWHDAALDRASASAPTTETENG